MGAIVVFVVPGAALIVMAILAMMNGIVDGVFGTACILAGLAAIGVVVRVIIQFYTDYKRILAEEGWNEARRWMMYG